MSRMLLNQTLTGKTDSLRIGWAQVDLTPDRPVFMIGQMYQRISRYVHDPITATALVLDNGREHIVLVSADMTEVPMHALSALRDSLAIYKDLDFSRISFHVTHTHNSTEFDGDFLRQDMEEVFGSGILPQIDVSEDILAHEEARRYLVGKLSELIGRAWENRQPGGISYSQDYAVVGFNRRPVFGSRDQYNAGQQETVMYGDCSEPGFLRFEGGSDHSADMLYTWDPDGRLTGVLVDIPCPAQVNELHYFLSADYWTPTRAQIREKLGNIHILPACGAAGDQNPLDLVRLSKHNKRELREWGAQTGEVLRNLDMTLECAAIGERIAAAVARGCRAASGCINFNPEFRHEVIDMHLPLRLVSQSEYEAAAAEVARIKRQFTPDHRMAMPDVVRAFEPQGVVRRWELQQKSQEYQFRVHILRLGNMAILTNPFELFHEFGIRIKARAKAGQVFIIQLANGIGGYLPTEDAVAGGSYSSKPASTTCGPEAGDQWVEMSLQLMDRLWEQDWRQAARSDDP